MSLIEQQIFFRDFSNRQQQPVDERTIAHDTATFLTVDNVINKKVHHEFADLYSLFVRINWNTTIYNCLL